MTNVSYFLWHCLIITLANYGYTIDTKEWNVLQQLQSYKAMSFKEELWNAITHGAGFLISIPVTVLLIIHATSMNSAVHIVTFSIFGASLILLFLMSTLLHSMPVKYKRFFAILDHSSIYILIAGTYTPFLLIAIGGA